MINVIPSGRSLGAEIWGMDLSRTLEPADVQKMLVAWSAHLVLLFRDQFISDAELISFSRNFGALDLCPPNATGTQHSHQHPELVIVSNVVVDGKPLGALGDGEVRWHSDMSNHPKPPKASALHALEVSCAGGETEYCNLYSATVDLPAHLRSAIEGKWANHDGTRDSSGAREHPVEVEGVRAELQHATHPLMRRHPDTGQPVLYLGRRPNQSIVDMDTEQGEALLDELWAHATQQKYVWSHSWRPGDLIVWDNRCVMHRRNAFPSDERRVMHRTQVTGDTVIPA